MSADPSSNYYPWITKLIIIDNKIIEQMSKTKFKAIVKEKVTDLPLRELNESKDKHRKSNYLYSSTFKSAPYIEDIRVTKKEAQLLFRLNPNFYILFGNGNGIIQFSVQISPL